LPLLVHDRFDGSDHIRIVINAGLQRPPKGNRGQPAHLENLADDPFLVAGTFLRLRLASTRERDRSRRMAIFVLNQYAGDLAGF
jgi:hypothetical protein